MEGETATVYRVWARNSLWKSLSWVQENTCINIPSHGCSRISAGNCSRSLTFRYWLFRLISNNFWTLQRTRLFQGIYWQNRAVFACLWQTLASQKRTTTSTPPIPNEAWGASGNDIKKWGWNRQDRLKFFYRSWEINVLFEVLCKNQIHLKPDLPHGLRDRQFWDNGSTLWIYNWIICTSR